MRRATGDTATADSIHLEVYPCEASAAISKDGWPGRLYLAAQYAREATPTPCPPIVVPTDFLGYSPVRPDSFDLIANEPDGSILVCPVALPWRTSAMREAKARADTAFTAMVARMLSALKLGDDDKTTDGRGAGCDCFRYRTGMTMKDLPLCALPPVPTNEVRQEGTVTARFAPLRLH